MSALHTTTPASNESHHRVTETGATRPERTAMPRLQLVHDEAPDSSWREADPKRAMTEAIVQRLGQRRYDMWFGCSSIDVRDGDTVCITAESTFVCKWIRSRLFDTLKSAAEHAFGRTMSLDIRLAPRCREAETAEGSCASSKTAEPSSRGATRSHAETGSSGTRSIRTQRLTGANVRQLRNLDDFVVGQSNELAYAAARQVSDHDDALGCSPLFIHGPCGVGKTHLLQGVCRRFVENAPRNLRVRYVTAEQFTNEYILAVQQNRLDAFRRAVRNLHVLAIDDMHFLSNKSRTQTEFLHTLDAIDMNGSRVVIASDNHPRRMSQLNQALVSRLLSGMVVEIGLPDEGMRIQLIESIAKQRSMQMTSHAVRALAQRCTGSVRELEGALTKIRALWAVQRNARLTGNGNGTAHANHQPTRIGSIVIEQLFADPTMMTRLIHIDRIVEIVCRRLAISLGDLTGNSRHSRIVLARGLIAYLSREMTTMSFPEIARAIGRKNHSTVHTAASRVQKQIEGGELIKAEHGGRPIVINDLLDQLRAAIRQRHEQ